MPEFERDGWRLHYGDAGEGPAVLLAHGLLFDADQFAPQVEALRDRYRVITPDARGHGRSEGPPEPRTQWDLMEDSLALIDHLGIDRPVWGGVSQGGFQAIRAALRHPERVAGLILIDTQAGAEDPAKAPMYEAFAAVAASDGVNDALLDAVAAIMFGSSVGDDLRRTWIERWRSRPTDGLVETVRCVTGREDLTDRLGEIGAAAAVVHGAEDAAIELERAERLAAGLSELAAPVVVVPAAGHTATLENPEPVTAAIEAFLASLPPWSWW